MSFFQDWLRPLLEDHCLLIVFLTMMAESACIPIPSEIVVPYGGFLAAMGFAPLWAVIVVATLANVVGSGIAYVVGQVWRQGSLPQVRALRAGASSPSRESRSLVRAAG